MDETASTALFPLHTCKTLHLVRHAQGVHNVEGQTDRKAYLRPELFDARITPLGWQQIDNLHKHVKTVGILRSVELVITSPLLRTMQTAAGVFRGDDCGDAINELVPLMVENAGNSNNSEVSSLNSPPILAVELCRERMGLSFCDKRRSISEYRTIFPGIDFSMMENDEDILWKPETRETHEELAARGMKFINWLWTRKEKEIAIVSHSAFLYNTLSAFGNDCHTLVKQDICHKFANCELRSVVIVDRGLLGSHSSTTNYLPAVLALPSDDIHDKHPNEGVT